MVKEIEQPTERMYMIRDWFEMKNKRRQFTPKGRTREKDIIWELIRNSYTS